MGKYEDKAPEQEQQTKNYKDWELPDIIKWCQENGQIDWLKAKVNEQRERPVYPKKKVARMDENGNPILTKKGKQSYTHVSDKSAAPIGTKTEKITFVELKSDFLHEFNLFTPKEPKQPDKPNMYDLINGL